MLKEIEGYIGIIKELHGEIKKLIDQVPLESLDWKPIEGTGELATNSMAALVIHMVGTQFNWIKAVIAGQPVSRDRDAEFSAKGLAKAELKSKLDGAMKMTEEILPGLTPAKLEESRKRRDQPVSVRWCILHVIEHLGMHIGHMQLTYQLWMVKEKR
jgi:hypothetical protein